MRPRGARSRRHCLPRRAGTTAAIFQHPIFLPPIFLPLEAKWGQARNSEPVKIRSSDLRYRNRCNVGRRIDAPGDGRAPGAIAYPAAPERPPPSFPTPFFCLPFFCHSLFRPLSRPKAGLQTEAIRSADFRLARRIHARSHGPPAPGNGRVEQLFPQYCPSRHASGR